MALLANGSGDTFPKESETFLEEGFGTSFERGKGGVDLGFMCGEEGVQVGKVDVCRALRLREGEVKEEYCLEGVVEGDPVTKCEEKSAAWR